MSAATVYIYDEIGYFGIGAQDFADEVGALDVDRLDVRINSPGGSVFSGLTIANTLIRHKAKVTVHVDGLAASIASVIAMAGNRVVMHRGSQMMIHMASGLCLGDADEMEKMAGLLRKVSRDSIAAAYQAKAGGKLTDWLDRMQRESWYNADEAIEIGLADEALASTSDQATAKAGGITARWQRHNDVVLGSGSYLAWSAAALARDCVVLQNNGGQLPEEESHAPQITTSPRGAGWSRRTRGALVVDAPSGAYRSNTAAAVRARSSAHDRVPVLAVPPMGARMRAERSRATIARIKALRAASPSWRRT